MSEPIVGIDLGTTNSEVAVFVDGRVETVEENGTAILPSCVGLDPSGALLVGGEARNQYVLSPERTVRSIKRRMGSDERVPLGDRAYLPQEISAMILRALKQRAERRLGCPVNKAVITVPAQFSDAQRQATRDAGAIAGLEVVRILNEPTAACLAYEAAHRHGGKNVLAFDLGGGTFDVSIVRMEGDVVEVIASHGDNHLGGDDFDEALANFLADRIYARQDKPALLAPLSLHRLNRAAETAKIHLSDQTHSRLIEDNLGTVKNTIEKLELEISRADFERLLAPFIDRTVSAAHRALADAGLKPADVDDIVLVGGSTRIPAVQDALEREFGKVPRRDVHPELAVAYGAGVMASRLMGAAEQRILVDITPYTFGTSCLGELNGLFSTRVFVPVIKSGTPLPVSRAEIFYTACDNQEAVDCRIFQGDNADAGKNILIGRFLVEGLSPVPSGNEIVLNMSLDLDGILRVTATEKATGLSKDVKIENALAKLTDDQISAARSKVAELFGEEDVEEAEIVGENSGVENKAGTQSGGDKIRLLLSRVDRARPSMDEADRRDTERLVAELEKAGSGGDTEAVDRIVSELEDILFYLETK